MSSRGSATVVLGIGMSSKATADEVIGLVHAALRDHCLRLSDVAVVATREHFVTDTRLDLGLPVVGVADDLLEASTAPCTRSIGIRARVAETAALLTASLHAPAQLLGPVQRSAHATVAVALPR